MCCGAKFIKLYIEYRLYIAVTFLTILRSLHMIFANLYGLRAAESDYERAKYNEEQTKNAAMYPQCPQKENRQPANTELI